MRRGLHRLALAVGVAMALAHANTIDAALTTWTSQGPEGGSVRALAIDPTNPQTLYAGADWFGPKFYRSDDGGRRWSELPLPNRNVGATVRDIVHDPLISGTVYVTGTQFLKSANGGASWSVIGDGLSSTFVAALAIHPANSLVLYASAGPGVSKSEDGGLSWSPAGTGFPNLGVSTLAIDPRDPKTIYAAAGGGTVVKSTNEGATWNTVGSVSPATSIAQFAIDPLIAGTLYAATPSYVFKSTDGGANWTRSSSGIFGGAVLTVAIDVAATPTIYAGNSLGVHKSTDGAASWTWMSTGLTFDSFVEVLMPHPTDPGILYAATSTRGGGVYKTTNAAEHWDRASNGLIATDVRALALAPSTPRTMYAGTFFDGIFKSSNGGTSWVAVNRFLGDTSFASLAVHPSSENRVYAGTSETLNNKLYETTTGGSSWSSITDGLEDSEISVIAIHPDTPDVMYVGTAGEGVFKSIDGGLTWAAMNVGLTYLYIARIVFDRTDPNTIYAGGKFGGLFKSTDGAANWTEIHASFGGAIAIDPGDSRVLYAAADGATAKSTDAGATWTFQPASIPGFEVEALAASHTTPTILYVAKNYPSGVFRSTNGGGSWSDFNSGLPDVLDIRDLQVDPTDPNTVYAATTQGVFGIGQALSVTPTPTPSFTPPRRTATATVGPTASTTPSPTLTPSPTSTPTSTATPTPEPAPESDERDVDPGGCCTTDVQGSGPTILDPVETMVCLPQGGRCAIAEARAAQPPPSGYSIVGQAITIQAPQATAGQPLVLVFAIDASQLPAGQTWGSVQILRNGDPVPTCAGRYGQAVPDPCVAQRRLTASGDVQLTVMTSRASVWNPVIPALDGLLCYATKATKGAGAFTPARGKRLIGVSDTLRSDALSAKAAATFDFVKPRAFCAPVGVDGGTIGRPAVGFQEYALKLPRTCSDDGRRCAKAIECTAGALCASQIVKVCADDGSPCLKAAQCRSPAKCLVHPKFVAAADIGVSTSLGGLVMHLGKPSAALIPTARSVIGPLPVEAPADRYKCYDVKPEKNVCSGDPARACVDDAACGLDGPCFRGFVAGRTVHLQGDLTPLGKTFVVKKPTSLCVPVSDDGTALAVPALTLQCFAIAPAPGSSKHQPAPLGLQNDFGASFRTTAKESELCVPAEAVVKRKTP